MARPRVSLAHVQPGGTATRGSCALLVEDPLTRMRGYRGLGALAVSSSSPRSARGPKKRQKLRRGAQAPRFANRGGAEVGRDRDEGSTTLPSIRKIQAASQGFANSKRTSCARMRDEPSQAEGSLVDFNGRSRLGRSFLRGSHAHTRSLFVGTASSENYNSSLRTSCEVVQGLQSDAFKGQEIQRSARRSRAATARASNARARNTGGGKPELARVQDGGTRLRAATTAFYGF